MITVIRSSKHTKMEGTIPSIFAVSILFMKLNSFLEHHPLFHRETLPGGCFLGGVTVPLTVLFLMESDKWQRTLFLTI